MKWSLSAKATLNRARLGEAARRADLSHVTSVSQSAVTTPGETPPAPHHAASATHLNSAATRQQNCCSQFQMTNYLRISIHHNALLERTHFQQNEGAFVVLGPEMCTWSSEATLGCRRNDHTGCLRS